MHYSDSLLISYSCYMFRRKYVIIREPYVESRRSCKILINYQNSAFVGLLYIQNKNALYTDFKKCTVCTYIVLGAKHIITGRCNRKSCKFPLHSLSKLIRLCARGSMACSVLLHRRYRILGYKNCILRKFYTTTILTFKRRNVICFI
jgi:hypothetical protein